MIQEKYNLTEGHILPKLFKVSLPVILTSFMQMAYNLTDMFFIGNSTPDKSLNMSYTSSVGTGGFFLWLGAALFMLIKIGTEIRVSQATGRKDEDSARIYARTAVQLEFIFAVAYAVALFFFAKFWISIFNIEDVFVYDQSVIYLKIISAGMLFYLMNPVFSATLNGTGNTKSPFIINSIGLVLNIGLDYLFIWVFNWNVEGAAWATVIAQGTVSIVFIIYFFHRNTLLSKANFFKGIDKDKAKDILRLGYPIAIQSALFTFISMYIGRMIFSYGKEAVATNRIGSQVEAVSWRVAGGFQTALGAFVGQNFGAMQPKRVLKGVRVSLITMGIYGVFISILMYVLAKPAFMIFSQDPDTVPLGIDYLRILAFSQLFMIIEALIGGALHGLGKTVPQAINSLGFNALRIPMAYFFIQFYGLNGIWLAVTISSVFKGVVIYLWYKIYISTKPMFKGVHVPLFRRKRLNAKVKA